MNIYGFKKISKTYRGLINGIKKHNDNLIILDSVPTKLKDADCFYQTNIAKSKHFISDYHNDTFGVKYNFIKKQNKPVLVSESACFRNTNWRRYGWNHYGWTSGNFNNKNVDDSRWKNFEKKTNTTIQPWNSPGDNIIIIGQKEGDSALNSLYTKFGYNNFFDWVSDVISEIRNYSDRKIIIRPHPKNVARSIRRSKHIPNNFKNVEVSNYTPTGTYSGGESLDAELANAYCVITFSSNAGVDAVVKGIPVYAFDKDSMVYPLNQGNLSSIENLNYNIPINDWQNKIAYTFWNTEELESGETWAHLKPVYF